jgi:predicted TIM-barrel fold metal-dependent hydrolase
VTKFALLFFFSFFAMTTFPQQVTSPWANYKIIDIHAHIGSFQGYDLSTETLLANLQEYNIQMALISNIDAAHLPGTTRDLDEKTANQVTLEAVQKYPNLLRGLAWARPTDPNSSPANLEPFLRDHQFVGVKLHPEMNQFAADDSLVDGYLSLCAKYNVPAVFHSGAAGSNSDPKKIYRVAARHPTVPVILYHMGFKGPHDEAIAVVKESRQQRDAQLYLETAQAEPQAVLSAVKVLGAERVLFGTDASYFGKDHYARYTSLIELLRQELSDDAFTKVMFGNAIRLFKLEDN